MVKSQSNWNDYVKNFEPYELEEDYCVTSLMELFALKIDIGPRKHADISGKITIIHHPDVQTLFSRSRRDFLTICPEKITALNGGMKLPIDADGAVRIKVDLFDRTHGELEFERCRIDVVTGDEETEKEEEEEEEEEEEVEEETEEAYEIRQAIRAETEDEKKERMGKKAYEFCQAMRAAQHNQFDLWGTTGDHRYADKLLRMKLSSPHCLIEAMYAVYEDARAVSVEVTIVDWNPGYVTGSLSGMRSGRISDRLHVFGQVTASNSLLTDSRATSTLFDKAIDNFACLKLGEPIPFSKTIVVFPRKSSLKLNIDLSHATCYIGDRMSRTHECGEHLPVLPHQVCKEAHLDHEDFLSESLVKKTLEIDNQCGPCYRHIVDDGGPAKLLVGVTFHDL